MTALLSCSDYWGRQVSLEDSIWFTKILRHHPELIGELDAVYLTLTQPTLVADDKLHQDRACFYRLGVLKEPLGHTFLKVCVSFSVDSVTGNPGGGFVVTAYPTSKLHPRERQRWP